MLELKESYYSPVEEQMRAWMYDYYFKPLYALMPANVKSNAGVSAILAALRSGRLSYKNGIFSGKFNMRLSSELARFAKFDRRSKTWKGNPPPEIKAAAL